MAESPRVVVLGAGNIGCLYGARLARAGARVTLVDAWPEHVAAIQASGVRIDGLGGSFVAAVPATTDPTEAGPADLVLICVNNYSTAAAAAAASVVLAPDGFVLTLQNGLGHLEVLTAALGAERVVGGLTFHSGELREPGWVTHTNQGPTYLGELDRASTARVADLRELMARAGMDPVVEPDMLATIWAKFVHNCAINALCAASGLVPGQLHEVPALDDLQTRLIEETLALARARGIALADPDPAPTIKAYCRAHFHRVSMVQHLARGRPTEIDALNGYVARESARLGLAAPHSAALAALIKGIERGDRPVAGPPTARAREWSVLFKVEMPSGHTIDGRLRDALVAALPGADKAVDGGGTDFTLRLWVAGEDAARAVLAGRDALERARVALGLPDWRLIRAHGTSPELRRADAHDGSDAHLDDRRAWSVAVRLVAGPASARLAEADLARLRRLLPPSHLVLAGGDDALTVKLWVDADGAGRAALEARRLILDALDQVGLPGWQVVRMHPVAPVDRATEIYPGTYARL
jgi:2-dehydropantoate 2-reductase